jgi:hypothetical protein
MSKSVAVIGTRTPEKDEACAIYNLVTVLSSLGYSISTGMAQGVDQVAAFAAVHGLDVYLPWASYEEVALNELRKLNPHLKVHVYNIHAAPDWTESVTKYHPAASSLTPGAFRLHARNYGIVAGRDLVVTLKSNRPGGGGTGQGIRIAKALGIPLVERVSGTDWNDVDLISEVLEKLGETERLNKWKELNKTS